MIQKNKNASRMMHFCFYEREIYHLILIAKIGCAVVM